MAAENEACDWGEMPSDALVSVFGKLDVIEILTGAGLVCRAWHRLAASALGPHAVAPRRHEAHELWLRGGAAADRKGRGHGARRDRPLRGHHGAVLCRYHCQRRPPALPFSEVGEATADREGRGHGARRNRPLRGHHGGVLCRYLRQRRPPALPFSEVGEVFSTPFTFLSVEGWMETRAPANSWFALCVITAASFWKCLIL